MLERLDLPLDKIWASEQIRRVEKYIETRPHDENKGYKEQIVELAVEYQIDSKYTSFIAVNERDEKLIDIPLLQETVLDSPSGWNMRDSSELHSYVSPSFKVHNNVPCCMAEPEHTGHRQFESVRKSFASVSDKFYKEILSHFASEPPDEIGKFEKILQKIMDCEAMIIKKEAYQTLLDEIIEYLKLDSSSLSKEQIQKIKDEAPNVYALVEKYFKP
jgi:hypothetical protein